jgi:hypothetical protein
MFCRWPYYGYSLLHDHIMEIVYYYTWPYHGNGYKFHSFLGFFYTICTYKRYCEQCSLRYAPNLHCCDFWWKGKPTSTCTRTQKPLSYLNVHYTFDTKINRDHLCPTSNPYMWYGDSSLKRVTLQNPKPFWFFIIQYDWSFDPKINGDHFFMP